MQMPDVDDSYMRLEKDLHKHYIGPQPLYSLWEAFGDLMTKYKITNVPLPANKSNDGRAHYFYFEVVDDAKKGKVYEYNYCV